MENRKKKIRIHRYAPVRVKKISDVVDNFPDYREKPVQLYEAIHKYADAGYSKRKIAGILHCSRNTVIKYLNGDFESLCRKDFKSGLDKYYDYIVKELTAGMSRMDVLNNLVQKGYEGGKTAAYDYMNNIIKRHQIPVSLYKSTSADAIKKRVNYRNMIILAGRAFFVISG